VPPQFGQGASFMSADSEIIPTFLFFELREGSLYQTGGIIIRLHEKCNH
jgi:hypothetical protein